MNEKLPDPSGDRALLHEALLDAVGDDGRGPAEAEDAALRLAVTLGTCGLYGITGGDADDILPPPLALAASAAYIRWITESIECAKLLGDAWLDCTDPEDADDLATGWVRTRTDMMAAAVALYDAAAEYEFRGDYQVIGEMTGSALGQLIRDRIAEVPVSRVDEQLMPCRDILNTVADTPRIMSIRNQVSDPVRGVPWWLASDEVAPPPRPVALGTGAKDPALCGDELCQWRVEVRVRGEIRPEGRFATHHSSVSTPDRVFAAVHQYIALMRAWFWYFAKGVPPEEVATWHGVDNGDAILAAWHYRITLDETVSIYITGDV